MTAPAKTHDGTNFQLTKTVRRNFRWWHEAIIDDMLAHPTSTLEERSKRLGYATSYLSLLMNSDMFQAVYNERRANMRSLVDDSIAKKMADVADLGLDIMREKLEQKRSSIGFKDLTELNLGLLDRLGYSAKQSAPAVQVNVNNSNTSATVTPEALAEARGRLRALEEERAKAAVVEGPKTPQSLGSRYMEGAGAVLDLTPIPTPSGEDDSPGDLSSNPEGLV